MAEVSLFGSGGGDLAGVAIEISVVWEVFRKVVNISSIAGLLGNFGQISYLSAKVFLIALTRTLAKDWGRFKLNVNCVAFGYI